MPLKQVDIADDGLPEMAQHPGGRWEIFTGQGSKRILGDMLEPRKENAMDLFFETMDL